MSDLFLRPLFTWRSAVASPFGPENPTTRHVLLTLALHMNEKGESCFPSVELLVYESGLSKRAVIQHLRIAAELGWIGKRERRQRNGQGWRSMEYMPLIPLGVEEKVKAWDEERRARRLEKQDAVFHVKQGGAPDAPRNRGARNAPAQGGARQAERGASDDTDAVHDVHPSTSKNSSITLQGRGAASRAAAPRPGEDYTPSASVVEWMKAKGWSRFTPAYVEKFRLTCANQRRKPYRDLDKAFKSCVLDDWGGIRLQAQRAARFGEQTPFDSPRSDTCAYCERPWTSKPNGIPACDKHTTDALDQRPREPVPA